MLWAKKQKPRAVKRTIAAYERASCEYQIRYGLSATSAAAIRPARFDVSSRPAM